MKTATFIKSLDGFTGKANLYKLSEPVSYYKYDDDGNEKKHKTSYVVVSATYAMFSGNETYIFPSNKVGDILSWIELDGSYRGGLNHTEALARAGYSLSASGEE